MNPTEHSRLLGRLRALMSRTVVNGCTEQEELAAARLVGKMIEQLDAAGLVPPAPQTEPQVQADWARAERKSPEYQQALEKNTLEGLLKSAIQELALNHINTLSPPGRRLAGQPVQWVQVAELLQAHLAMMLSIGGSRLSRQILADTVVELIQDGLLPDRLAIPIGE